MKSRDPFELWKEERRNVAPSGAFADRVMHAVRTRDSGALGRWVAPSFARLAAVAVLAVAIQVVWFCAVLLALPGAAN